MPFLVVMTGCGLELPEISRNHPASAEAPAGLHYAVTAVLEVRPFIRPPDQPTTQPAHPMEHESQDVQHMDHDQSARPAHQDIKQVAPRKEGQPMQHMRREGQLHE
ncbi:MAG: hypothetical protein AMXMBFR13_36660 [Phycisphaerae bacterium]